MQTNSFFKKIIIPFVLIAAGSLFFVHLAEAQTLTTTDLGLNSQIQTNLGGTSGDIRLVIANIIRVAFGLLGIVALGIVLYGGFVFMTAGGNEEKIQMAKKVLRNGVIGLIIILSAYAIVSFVIKSLVDANNLSTGGIGTGGGGGGGGNPFISDHFFVTSLPPSMELCVRNAKLAVVFNKEVDIATIPSSITVFDTTDSANPATTTGSWAYGSNKNTVLFTPEGSCGTDPGNDCFKSKNAYRLTFTSSKTIESLVYGKDVLLDCASHASCGPVDFVSGETVNRTSPVITIQTPEPQSQFAIGDLVPVNVHYESSGGLQNVSVFVTNDKNQRVQVDGSSGASCKVSGDVPLQWQTDGFASGAYTIEADGVNFSGLTGQAEVGVSLRPGHCVNGVLDNGTNGTTNLGEEQLGPPECGGECGSCGGGTCSTNADCAGGICQNNVCVSTLAIRDYSPRSGAAGTFVSIIGSNFGSTPGHVYFTDGAAQPAGTNLVKNPSIETNTTGWGIYINAVIERTAEASYNGQYALKLLSSKTQDNYYYPRATFYVPNLTPGATYTASVWVKRTAGTSVPGLVVKTIKTAGGESRQNAISGNNVDAWQRLSFTYTLQADENQILISPGIPNPNVPGADAIYIDAVQLEQGAVATSYIDGTLGSGYSWSGTPHASASTREAGVSSVLEAQLAPCGVSKNSWAGNQIIVQVPQGMSVAQGIIKVVSAPTAADPAGQEDTTANKKLPNFDFSTVVHPGVCAVSPARAVAGALVEVQGNNFGSSKTATDAVVLSGVKSTVATKNGNTAWQDTSVSSYVPGLVPGPVSLKVVNNGIDSNSVRFVVDDGVVAGSPIIESVSPDAGPAGEYVTIRGKNFGTSTGQVWFKVQPGDAATIIGDFDFPAACAKMVWQDNQIIVKFPKAKGVENTNYVVMINTGDNHTSAFNPAFSYKFTSGSPSPGICALSPSSGPVPLPAGVSIEVIGEYLLSGSTVTDPVQALFWSLSAANVRKTDGRPVATLQSASTQGETDKLTVVPTGAVASGPVSVYRPSDKKISNGINFAVSDCTASGATCGAGTHCCAAGTEKGVCQLDGVLCKGEKVSTGFVWKFSTKDIPPTPHVVERCDSISESGQALPSPSPSKEWNTLENNDALAVCKQALVTVEFDAPLNQSTISANAGTVVINKCSNVTADGCVGPINVQLTPGSYTLNDAQSSGNSHHQSLSLQPAGTWEDNAWYQVVLSQGIKVAGFDIPLAADKPCGGDSAYCFYFKSGSQDCALKEVVVTPYSYWTNILESPMKKTPRNSASPAVEYRGNGLSDQRCVMMSMEGWNWKWESANDLYTTVNGPAVNIAAHFNALANTVGINLPNDKVDILATASKNGVSKTGTSPLTIDLSNPQVISYWPQCQEACTNAEVAVQFNMGLSSRNLLNPATVRLLKCYDDNCAKTDDVTYTTNVKLDVAPPYATIKIANAGGGTVIHKGPNLVTNGFADAKNSSNFSPLAYSNETHGGQGSFTYNKSAFYSFSTDVIPVDPTKTYYVEGWAKSGDADGSNYNPINRQHMGVAPVDVDGNLIDAIHTLKVGGSANTKLSADLNPGDTVMHLDDVTGWQNGEPNYQRQMMWYGYKDSKGHVYPDYEYTRNTTFDFYANGIWTYRTLGTWAVGGINPANKTITLTSKWPGPLVKAGTAVSNATAGAVYRYLPGSGQNISKTWTKFSGTIGGYDTKMDGTNYYTTFPYGTVGAKIMFINNYGMVGTDAPNTIHWSDIQFYDTSAYTPASNNALEPNTLYKVLVSNASANPNLSTNNIWGRSKINVPDSYGKPYNEQFSWRFKTKTTACDIDRVAVNPVSFEAATVNDRALYAATTYSAPDSCAAEGQKLNATDVSWDWRSLDTAVATVTATSTKGYSPYCNAACVRKGSSVPATDKTEYAVCGNNIVEAGEDCDAPNSTANCSLDCRKITGKNTGSFADPDPKNIAASTCGSGQIGAGEDCDLGITASVSNPKSAFNCTDSCLHTGTKLSSKWCFDNHKERGGFSLAEYTAACATAISICGNNVTEPEEDPGCDLGGGNHAAWCNDSCVAVKTGAGNNRICDPVTEGCAAGEYHLGSSLEYSAPSICGDGAVGIGEDAICEQNDTLVITNTKNLFNPWALAVGVGAAEPTGDPLSQKTTIAASTVVPTGTKEGSGTFSITCGYTKETQCTSIDDAFGLATNSCCYARAVLGTTIPTNGDTSVCRNTAIQANFNGQIDSQTLPGNLLIAYNNGNKACGYDSGICKVSGDPCSVNADCAGVGDSCVGAVKVFEDNFENGYVKPSWTPGSAEDVLSIITAPSGEHYLGTDPVYGFINKTATNEEPHYAKDGERTNPTLRLAGLPNHKDVTVEFDVYTLNSWDLTPCCEVLTADMWSLDADGKNVYTSSFANVPAKASGALRVIPNNPGWATDQTYHIIATFPHSSSILKLDFKGLQDQANTDESWGLDNVKVYVGGGTNALDVQGLNLNNGKVWCVGSTLGSVAVSSTNATASQVSIALNNALKPNTEYAVVLTDGVKDTRGVALGAGVSNNETVYEQNFESMAVDSVWTSQTSDALLVVTSPNGAEHFLGTNKDYGFINKSVLDPNGERTNPTLTLSDLPVHGEVTVDADVYVINSWDGNGLPAPHEGGNVYGEDPWQLEADGAIVYKTNFLNIDSAPTFAGDKAYYQSIGKNDIAELFNVPPSQAYPNQVPPGGNNPFQFGVTAKQALGYEKRTANWFGDATYHIKVSFPHNAKNLKLDFKGLQDQDAQDESWGLDNVKVSISGQPTAVASWRFTTGNDVCEIKSASVNPSSVYFSRATDSQSLMVMVSSTAGAVLQPIPGLYAWQYKWRPTDSQFMSLLDVTTADNTVSAKNQNGEVDARAFVQITDNKISNATGTVATASSHVTVYLCENPWPTKAVAGRTQTIGRRTTAGGTSQEFSSSISAFPYQDSPNNHSGFNDVFDGSSIPRTTAPIGDGYFNFSSYYCADNGSYGTADDYPYLRPAVQVDANKLKLDRGICELTGKSCINDDSCSTATSTLRCINNSPFKRFIFSNDKNGDAIGVQILPNVKHLTPAQWYSAAKNAGGAGFTGAMQQVTVSGYDAVSDGNNIYVAALNVAGDVNGSPNLYDVIYQFSINANAEKETRYVFQELIKNLRFNTNLTHNDGYCGPTIDKPAFSIKCTSDLDCSNGEVCANQVVKLQRNFNRLRGLQTLDSLLVDYYSSHANLYPGLSEGTYLAGQSISTWPSWNTLGNAVGSALPVDPINRLAPAGTCKNATNVFCIKDSDCGTDTCVLHDAATGWSAADRRFSFACAVASYAYRYKVENKGKSFTVYNRFENPGFSPLNLNRFVTDFGFSNLVNFDHVTSSWSALGNLNGICTGLNEISSLNQGTCGDGVVNANQGEECDPVGSKRYENVEACPNGATVQTCSAECKWGPATSPVACNSIISFKCGNNKIDPGEVCDEGNLNGSYNHCAADCRGKVAAYSAANPAASPGYCGDGAINSKFELCDKGVTTAVYAAAKENSCNWNCQSYGPFCGDGVVNGPAGAEECDGDTFCSFNRQPGTKKCTADCKWQVAAAAQPIAWWPLGDDDNVYRELIPSGAADEAYNGPAGPKTIFGAGEKGNDTSKFDGISQTIIAPVLTVPANVVSVEAWIKPESNVVIAQRVLEKGGWNSGSGVGGFGLEFNRSEQANGMGQVQRFIVWRNTSNAPGANESWTLAADSDVELPLNEWSHIVGTYQWDSASKTNIIKVYVNGRLAGTNSLITATPFMGATSDILVIGGNSHLAGRPEGINYFKGSIDNVKIYNKVLTDTEIKNEFTNTTPCVPNTVQGGAISTVSGSCGNGVIESNEACDSGATNGNACTPSYGAACSYCAAGCKNIINIQPKEFCGDGVLQTQNEKCEVIDGVLRDAAGVVGLCSADKNTKVNLETAKAGVDVATLQTYKKGEKSCNATCSSLLDNCVECGLDQKGGKLVSGSIINVLDSANNNGVSALDIYYVSSVELGQGKPAYFKSSYQVAYAKPTTASGKTSFVFKAAPPTTTVSLVQDARLISNALCFSTTTAAEAQYYVVVNNDLEKAFPLPASAVNGSYNLVLSPRITAPSHMRFVVSWKGTSNLVGGFVKTPGYADILESPDRGKGLHAAVGANYAQTTPAFGVWYHGVKGSINYKEESFTVDTNQIDQGTYQFYVSTADGSPIENLRAAGEVQIEVYASEGGSGTFGRPIKTYVLSQAAKSDNSKARYWYAFSVTTAADGNHMAPVRVVDPNNASNVTTYQNGRIATDPAKF